MFTVFSRRASAIPRWSPRDRVLTVVVGGGVVLLGVALHSMAVAAAGVAILTAGLLLDTYRLHRYHEHLDALLRHALQDPLTGLPTRPAINRLLDSATQQGAAITVALADVDGLHAVNSNLGHAGGDQYLVAVADRLAAALPAEAFIGRMGGDEFVIIAPGLDPDHLHTVLAATVGGPNVIGGYHLQARASIGIAASTGDAWRALACADAALYRAKEAGGNQILRYSADRDGVPELDGTRPVRRRRDHSPARRDDLAWTPAGRDDLVPVLVTVDELGLLHHAVSGVRDRWATQTDKAQAAADQPAPAEPAGDDTVNVRPTPAELGTIATRCRADHDRYATLTDRLALILAAVPDADTGGGVRPVGIVLSGISGARLGFLSAHAAQIDRYARAVIALVETDEGDGGPLYDAPVRCWHDLGRYVDDNDYVDRAGVPWGADAVAGDVDGCQFVNAVQARVDELLHERDRPLSVEEARAAGFDETLCDGGDPHTWASLTPRHRAALNLR